MRVLREIRLLISLVIMKKEGRRKKEEGRGKREEGRRKKEEGTKDEENIIIFFDRV